MEEVIGPIRDEERSKVQNDLHEKDKRISSLEGKLNISEVNHKEEIRKLREEYEAKLKKLSGTKEQITKDNIIGSQAKQIVDLQWKLKKVLAQSFWERVFSPVHIEI